MNGFSEETRQNLLSIINDFINSFSISVSSMTLYDLIPSNKSLTMELFSQSVEEYLFFTVSEKVVTSFSEGLKKAQKDICRVLIVAQGGEMMEYDSENDLNFRLKNGIEYHMNIVSKNDSKSDVVDFWAIIGGSASTYPCICDLLNGAANNLSISSMINQTHRKILGEWRNQD